MKIEKIQKKGLKYKIYLDDQTVINTYDQVLIKYNLLYKKEIDEKLLNKVHADNEYYDAYSMVIKQIDKRLRSEYEIEKYLIKHDIKYYKEIINDLKGKGLIDDRRFTKAFISDKIHLSYDGKNKIKKELLEHKIDDDIINEGLNNINDECLVEKVDKIIEKKIRTNKKDSEFVLKQKILKYLYNLGYSKSMIEDRMGYFDFTNKFASKEMNKIYNKLSLKYKEKELITKLKQKLYSKGYSIEEINDYIEKKF